MQAVIVLLIFCASMVRWAMSIYMRLFKYRERPRRAPKEDFLSEALVDILSRMNRDEMISAVEQLFLTNSPRIHLWRERLQGDPGDPFIWSTQYQIEFDGVSARPDIVLMTHQREILLIVENKVNAAFQEHEIEPGDSEEPSVYRSQLKTYGQWLASRSLGGKSPDGLVLLTHSVPPPEGFGAGSLEYGVDDQLVVKWSSVYKWLVQNSSLHNSGTLVGGINLWRQLAGELTELLEDWGMSAEVMTQFDLSAAEVFAQSRDRISESFECFWPRVKSALSGVSIYSHQTWDFDSHGATMSDSVYLLEPQERRGSKWYLAWGVRFPSKSRWWDGLNPALPTTNHAYLSVVVERAGFPGFRRLSSKIPQGWAEAENGSELVIGEPLASFAGSAEEFTEKLGTWFVQGVETLKPALIEVQAGNW
ncbi:hypothetical protein [Bradyrhizobium oligotrophicum]|uniref:hypothetical protein n=1 Tax=Bradyrhizobium oligotrophicum TaxID=44255 RepID=UPI003EBF628F